MKNKGTMFGVMGLGLLIATSCISVAEPVTEPSHASLPHIEESLRATVAFVHPRGGMTVEIPPELRGILTVENPWEPPFCAGFNVSPNFIVSAAHCFERTMAMLNPDGTVYFGVSPFTHLENETVRYFRYEDYDQSTGLPVGEPSSGRIMYHDHGNDTVVIFSEEATPNFLDIARRVPDISERVYAVGHPGGVGWSFIDGMITRIFRNDHTIIGYQTSVITVGGNSGGPLITMEGEVIGMADAFIGENTHLSLYVSNQTIYRSYNLGLVSLAVETFNAAEESSGE